MLTEQVDKKEVEASDSLECDVCGNEIIHDDFLFLVSKGFNMHGSPMPINDEETKILCKECVNYGEWGGEDD